MRRWESPPEPEGVHTVRDIDGYLWHRCRHGGWTDESAYRRAGQAGGEYGWRKLLYRFGPRTEIGGDPL